MNVFAFDAAENGCCNPWKKCWGDLGQVVAYKGATLADRQLASKSITGSCDNANALLLVHQQECAKLVSEMVDESIKIHNTLFVLYVSTGSCSVNSGLVLPRIHYSHRSVPTGQNLSYLRPLFSKLCNALDNSGGDTKKILAAWEEWESPVMGRLVAALSPLAVLPRESMAAASVSGYVRENLRHAASELDSQNEGEKTLRDWLWGKEGSSDDLIKWVQTHAGTLQQLARRFL